MNTKSNNVGGNEVKAGFYWNKKEWAIVTISGKGGVLPGSSETAYVKVPVVMMLGLAPLMGGLYVMFLPLIGFAMLAHHLANKVRHTTAPVAVDPSREATVSATH